LLLGHSARDLLGLKVSKIPSPGSRKLLEVQFDVEFPQLLPIDFRWGVDHDVPPTVVLGEGYEIPYALLPSKYGHQAVQSKGDPPVWGCPVLEGIHQKPELFPGLFGAEAQMSEEGLLGLFVVDPDGTAADLIAVEHQVVGIGLDRSGIAI